MNIFKWNKCISNLLIIKNFSTSSILYITKMENTPTKSNLLKFPEGMKHLDKSKFT